MMALQRRPSGVGRPVRPMGADPDDGFRQSFPHLWEFVTLEAWPDGGEDRVPGSFLVFLQDGMVKVMLADKDAQEVCFVTAGSVWEALLRAESVLMSGEGDWRPDRQRKGQQGGRRRPG